MDIEAPPGAKHVNAVINRAEIPDVVEVSFGLEISFDGGETWGEDFLDAKESPEQSVCYSHQLGATARRAGQMPAGMSTEAARGTDLPPGRKIAVRIYCSDGVAVRAEFS